MSFLSGARHHCKLQNYNIFNKSKFIAKTGIHTRFLYFTDF